MNKFVKIFVVAFALVAMASIAVNAQYLISTKAGFVNRVEGKVFIQRQDSEDGKRGRASQSTQMRDGDRIITEADSRVELLLSPGSYLRLDQNSEVQAVNTSFEQVRFELLKGAASVEISTSSEQSDAISKNSPLEIITPHGAVSIGKDGLYRFDAFENNTLIQVRQGELYVGDRASYLARKAFKIKRGNAIKLNNSPVNKSEMAKINKDSADEFDAWCFGRAQTLTAANISALQRSRTMSSLRYGWFYNSFYNCYTFIPSRGLYFSPYGFGFFNSYADCLYYYPYGYGYPYYRGGYYGGGSSGGGSVPNVPSRVVAGNDRAPIMREIQGRRIDSGPSFNDRGFSDYGSSRSISTSSSSSSATSISAPAPARTESSSSGGRAGAPTRP
ncbi:MAG: FecR domain-containing protein [Blastocatellales bacterium]